MKISVVMPCYNSGPWIGGALRSIAAQTLRPHEVIVVDDNSTDDSVERVRASGVHVRLLTSDRRNAAGTRNIGMRAATGDWVALIDADDEWYPAHLARAAEVLGRDDVAYLCTCDVRASASGAVTPSGGWGPPWPGAPTAGLTHGQFIDWFAAVNSFAHSGVVLSRARVLEVGGFDEQLKRRHDYEHVMRVIAGRTWAFDPRPGVIYQRDTPNSISRNLVECELFFLTGLIKNRPQYDSPAMRGFLRRRAKLAVRAAMTSGSPQERRQAWELGAPYLTGWERAAVGVLHRVPALGRIALRARAAG